MIPARSSALRGRHGAGPGPREAWTGGIGRGSFFVSRPAEPFRRSHRSPTHRSRMMQAPHLHTTNALPAAEWAVPGTRPSCAVEPRGPLGIAAPADYGSKAARGRSVEANRIHRIGTFGQDRRDQEDQRGRAVACASEGADPRAVPRERPGSPRPRTCRAGRFFFHQRVEADAATWRETVVSRAGGALDVPARVEQRDPSRTGRGRPRRLTEGNIGIRGGRSSTARASDCESEGTGSTPVGHPLPNAVRTEGP